MEKDDRQVAEWYNTSSSSYDELYGSEQSSKYEKVLELLRSRRFQILVDIGCGTGGFLEKTREHYDHAVGIDLSIRMLRIASSRKTPNTDYLLGSSSSLPLRDSSSDGTVSISTAKADHNLSLFIHDLQRICHKDSFLAFTLFHEPGMPVPESLPKSVRSVIISERETLYLIHPADEPE